jgi:hypothetical protein
MVTNLGVLSCSLPVAFNDPVTGAAGGFVRFSSGQVTVDPASALRWSPSAFVNVTVTKPALDGDGGPVYDWPQHRWLPAASPQVISPDGSAYVYGADTGGGGIMPPNRLRVVAVATGDDRLLYSSGNTDVPVAWTAAGIYVVQEHAEIPSSGLRILNPTTGAARVITYGGDWVLISAGAAWGFTGAPSSPTDYSPHSVDRLDLATGKVTRWYSAPYPHNVNVAGLDTAGRPVIIVDHHKVLRLLGPSQTQAMFNVPVVLFDGTRMQLDTHGLWFSTSAGNPLDGTPFVSDVWLYSYATGLRKVVEMTNDRDPITAIAGPCR